MKRNLIFFFLVLFCMSTLADAKNTKTKTKTTVKKETTKLSNAEKMGYSRSNKLWGPGTYYSFAPGKPINKMANNTESAMRDLTGISAEDLYKEIAKQGFTEVPKNEVKGWFNYDKTKDIKFYYAPDKSYILNPGTNGLSHSTRDANGYGVLVSSGMCRSVLIPKEDSSKVMDAIWQYLRDINELKAMLVTLDSKYKNSREEVYPFEQAAAFGWSNFRAGAWIQVMVNGKPKNYFERHENILRRTIGNPGFDMFIYAIEPDYGYSLRVMLKKEGYILHYNVLAPTMMDIQPGVSWAQEHKRMVAEYDGHVKIYKNDIDKYKGKLPPNIEDLNKLLHIK